MPDTLVAKVQNERKRIRKEMTELVEAKVQRAQSNDNTFQTHPCLLYTSPSPRDS